MQQIVTHLENNIWHNQVTHPQGTQCRMGLNRHWKWFSRWKFYFLSPNPTRISIPNNFGVFPIPWPRFYLSPPHLTRVAKALTHLNPRRRELYFKRALMQFCCLTSGRPLKTIKLSVYKNYTWDPCSPLCLQTCKFFRDFWGTALVPTLQTWDIDRRVRELWSNCKISKLQ